MGKNGQGNHRHSLLAAGQSRYPEKEKQERVRQKMETYPRTGTSDKQIHHRETTGD